MKIIIFLSLFLISCSICSSYDEATLELGTEICAHYQDYLEKDTSLPKEEKEIYIDASKQLLLMIKGK